MYLLIKRFYGTIFYCKRVNTIDTLQVPLQVEPSLVPPVKTKLQAPTANGETKKVSVKLQYFPIGVPAGSYVIGV
jgi:hypothetical protein